MTNPHQSVRRAARGAGMVYDATEGLRGPARGRSASPPTSASIRRRRACTSASLLTVMGLARLQRFGHSPIAIVGGGTGMIGDPSGKSQERHAAVARADRRERRRHPRAARSASSISTRRPIRRASSTTPTGSASFDLLGFLRDTGKHFTVNYMLQKESVNRRLESEEGISFTEFSYLLLQALRLPRAVRSLSAARCRWAAAISGATSPPASI